MFLIFSYSKLKLANRKINYCTSHCRNQKKTQKSSSNSPIAKAYYFTPYFFPSLFFPLLPLYKVGFEGVNFVSGHDIDHEFVEDKPSQPPNLVGSSGEHRRSVDLADIPVTFL